MSERERDRQKERVQWGKGGERQTEVSIALIGFILEWTPMNWKPFCVLQLALRLSLPESPKEKQKRMRT